MVVLEVNNLSVVYSEYKALNNISFKINQGDFLNIIGPNGSGKTTLVEVLTNLKKPTSGNFKINESNVGFLPQNLTVKKNFPITVKEVILSGNKKTDYSMLEKWLEIMDIKHLEDKNISYLSGGEQQRVFLVRTLLSNPKLLILDEPTSALDPTFRAGFYLFLESYQKEYNTTIINVTHHLESINVDNSKTLYIDREIKYFGLTKDFNEINHKGDHHV
ncbi:MAG TPA: ATP-binding cassette domain-containing protein [Acholeplasma sp.]|nr:ATP-binding cassette domain-containing protein [Acholeplasma sp.]